MTERGKYIVIEGPEGSGKSTVSRFILGKLGEQGVHSLATREPGGTPIGEVVRDLILSTKYSPHVNTEAALFAASRSEIWHNLILPKLLSGTTVVSDRNYLSSVIYQGYAGDFDPDLIVRITEIFTSKEYMNPDLTLVLLPKDVAQGMERVYGRGESLDRIEQKEFDYHQKVYENYVMQAHILGRVAIDASLSEDEVQLNAWHEVKKCLGAELL